MTAMIKTPADLAKLPKALVVQVWGSDERRLRRYNEFHDSDVEEIAAAFLVLMQKNEELREHEWIVRDGFTGCTECHRTEEAGHASGCSWLDDGDKETDHE